MSKDIKKPIVLIGLMGAGKTTLGRDLAKARNLNFLDIDELITEVEGLTIPEIFEKEGEAYFRHIEKEITENAIQKNPDAVISLGGGAFMNENIRDFIKKNAFSVFIKADIDTLIKRIGEGAGRPLLKNNPQESLKKLMEQRYPVYEQADLTVQTKDELPQETLNRVMDALYNSQAVS